MATHGRLPVDERRTITIEAVVWWKSRGRTWHARRRSKNFNGLILHAGVFAESSEHLYLIECVPPGDRRKSRFIGHGASTRLFKGEMHLHRYTLDRMVTGAAFEEAARKMAQRSRNP